MNQRTVVHASYDEYLEFEYPATSGDTAAARDIDMQERQVRLATFPHHAVLQLAFPELDFANRWCWQQFGPADGNCLQSQSEYPACELRHPHTHAGKWQSHWLVKTNYDFGYNEWYFAHHADRERFLQFVPQINWGERYPT